jgi:hypothetical protein
MVRRGFFVIALCSILLWLGAAGLFLRGIRYTEHINYWNGEGEYSYQAWSDDRGIELWRTTTTSADGFWFDEFKRDQDYVDPYPFESYRFAGFQYKVLVEGYTPFWTWCVRIPQWWLLSAPLIPPAWWVWRRRKTRRSERSGLCTNCGYDLRATPNRCPECGTIPDLPLRQAPAPT